MAAVPHTTAPEAEQPAWLRQVPSFYLPLILLIAAGYAWRPIGGGSDFWAHAAIGRWVVEHGQLPHDTLFLWSEKQRWLLHAWLTQVFFYELMSLGGERGGPFLALFVTMACSAFPWFFAYRVWRWSSRPHALMVPLFLITIWVSSPRFTPRPELFTACLLALLYFFLLSLGRRQTYSWAHGAGVLLMFALWPNLHGAVAFGLLILWSTVFCDLLQPALRPILNREADTEETTLHFRNVTLPLAATAVVATLLVFIANPHGLEYWRVLMPVQSQTFKKIDEWKPFWVPETLSASAVVAEFGLALLALVLWFKSRDKRLAQLIWILVMTAFFVMARRNLWLTAMTSLFVIAANSGPLETERLFAGWRAFSAKLDPKAPTGTDIPVPMRIIVRAGITALLLIGLGQSIPKDWLPLHAVDPKLPTRMANFVLTRTKGRLLNDYEYSAYLEWAFHDKRELYIDLNNAYPDSLMDEYFAITAGPANFEELLDKRGIQVIALRIGKVTRQRTEGIYQLTGLLNTSKNWKHVYKGADGNVWVRAKP